MLRIMCVAAFACLLTTAAEARHYKRNSACIETGDVMRPCPTSTVSMSSVRAKFAHTQSADRNNEFVQIRENPVIKRMGKGLRRVMAEGAGRVVAPARFIHGRLVCAVNVGVALAARGIRGTGSRLAKSYLHWGHASGPVPGAVAVFNRRGGGHVAIVHHVRPDGTVIYLNPSSRRQAWQVGPYSRKPIAYRVAGGW